MRSPHDVILRPIISERSMSLLEGNKYTFLVHPDANKVEIRRAVEEIFKVKVVGVNTIKVHGKKRRQGRTEGYRPDRKKAVVTLRAGDKIEIMEGL